jgi:hypothetical protein
LWIYQPVAGIVLDQFVRREMVLKIDDHGEKPPALFQCSLSI